VAAKILNIEKNNETAETPSPLSKIGSDAEGSTAAIDEPDAQKVAAKCTEEVKAGYLLAIKANVG
jgi:hypothetical protein